jgi:hypothetical protein
MHIIWYIISNIYYNLSNILYIFHNAMVKNSSGRVYSSVSSTPTAARNLLTTASFTSLNRV